MVSEGLERMPAHNHFQQRAVALAAAQMELESSLGRAHDRADMHLVFDDKFGASLGEVLRHRRCARFVHMGAQGGHLGGDDAAEADGGVVHRDDQLVGRGLLPGLGHLDDGHRVQHLRTVPKERVGSGVRCDGGLGLPMARPVSMHTIHTWARPLTKDWSRSMKIVNLPNKGPRTGGERQGSHVQGMPAGREGGARRRVSRALTRGRACAPRCGTAAATAGPAAPRRCCQAGEDDREGGTDKRRSAGRRVMWYVITKPA